MNNLRELLKHELGDLLFAEKTILKATKKMAREVSDPAMRERLEAHHGETEGQIQNLERAFEAIGERARAQKCPGILGIVKEHDEFKSDEEPSKPMLEAFDLGSGLRVEHYEIAAYRSATAVAKALGEREVVELLQENLAQEIAMAKFIEAASAATLRMVHAAAQAEENEEGGARRGASKRGASKGGASKGGASKRGGSKGGAKRAASKRTARAG
jgi:ferritin-like metal-binding protein YciE